MRVVGGLYKGRKLAEFKGFDIRPTSDMVRESLFNILRNDIRDASFLDIFCGTGAMGIEALSRGAKRVVFNDISKESLKVLSENLSHIGITEGYKVSNADAFDYVSLTNEKFNIIYIDPPYKLDLGEKMINVVSSVLEQNGIAIYENEKPYTFNVPTNLAKYDERKYGRAYLTFFRKVN